MSNEVSKNSKGIWCVRPYIGTHAITGKPLRPYKSFPEATSREHAQKLADEWIDSMTPLGDRGMLRTISDLLDDYISKLESKGKSPSTPEAYRSAARCYIKPYIGDMDVAELKPYMVDDLYRTLAEHGSKDGGPLSHSTIAKVHSMMSGAYKTFVRDGLAEFNPFSSCESPRRKFIEARAFDPDELQLVKKLIESGIDLPGEDCREVLVRNTCFAAYVSLYTGMRIGEICALTRRSVNKLTSSIRVSATMIIKDGKPWRKDTTKTGKGRTIPVTEAILSTIATQLSWMEKTVERFGGKTDGDTPLICSPFGSFYAPNEISKQFSRMRDEYGISKATHFHTLRHSHATYLLFGGIDMRTAQDRLGHSDVATTLRLYSHVLPERYTEAGNVFEKTMDNI